MKTTNSLSCAAAVGLAFVLGLNGCEHVEKPTPAATRKPTPPDPLAILLAAPAGDSRVDTEIRQRQEQIRAGQQTDIALERLGWLFVAKARESFDPGFYKLAEQCAFALDARQPRGAEAMLLRAHVLQNLHRFAESEALARELVAARGLAFDFGAFGDALMEQGRLDEAIEAYQKMADLKPDLHAQLRAAHVRWLRGDLDGAIEMMQLAAGAVSPRDADTAAWALTRLAGYQFQAGQFEEARRIAASALEFRPDYPPALLLRGRMLLAENKNAEAADVLRLAEKQNPLPEYQWALADAFAAAGQTDAAHAVEEKLRRHGAKTDPRTFALFLTTRGESRELALRLAEEEMKSRGDVFTLDALAWAEAVAGKPNTALCGIERALTEGTQDARLFLHAAIIAGRAGDSEAAKTFFGKAFTLRHLLLPSERKHLQTQPAQSNDNSAVAVAGGVEEKF
jgi:tetratricopeptide (TPR) repeat protein